MSSFTQRAIHTRMAAAILFLVLALPAGTRASSADVAPGPLPDLSQIHIANFGRVNANYFRGAEPKDEDYASLASVGIKTIVDLRSNDADPGERLRVERAGMKYVQIPMTTHEAPTAAMIERFLQIVDDPANGPVYVHCVGGRHRTGVMTAIYRMTRQGWSAVQAFKEMKTYKFGADFLHPEFKKFVLGYHAMPDAPLVVR
jgi:protein tyrosine/serine phosphatase